MGNKFVDITKILVERKILKEGITISARIPISGFGGAPIETVKTGIITTITNNGITAIYEDRKKRTTGFETIESIEGMGIPRFAQAYKVKVSYKKSK